MTGSRVALPMYDWPEIRTETDQFYALLRESLSDRGFAPPASLERDTTLMPLWQSPDLLLAQTCGLPYVTHLQDRVSLVGTPSYDIDCSAGRYFSVLVVNRDSNIGRLEELDGARFAFSDPGSQSGFAAPMFHLLEQAPAVAASLTLSAVGSHRAAMRAVVGGEADAAAIDAVAWVHAGRHERAADQLRVLARTPPTPGLPFIAARRSARETHRLYLAVVEAMAALNESVRDTLLLTGFSQTRPQDYQVIEKRHASVCARLNTRNAPDPVTEGADLPLSG